MQPDVQLPDLSTFAPCLSIERRQSPSRAEFEQEYLAKPGKPVILPDVAQQWPCLHKWTFDFFAAWGSDREIVVSDRLMRSNTSLRLQLKTFLEYCKSPDDPRFRNLGSTPLYFGFQPFASHPELLNDFTQPAIVDCIYEKLNGDLRKWYLQHFGLILVGTAGTITPLHADMFKAHGWLAQICGRKYWLAFSPDDAENLYDGKADLSQPDLEKFPKLRNAQPYQGIVQPGEVIFIPQGWYHHVVALDSSLSFGFNFVNQTNFMEHILGICKEMPRWMQRINSPDFRKALSIAWTWNDFALPR